MPPNPFQGLVAHGWSRTAYCPVCLYGIGRFDSELMEVEITPCPHLLYLQHDAALRSLTQGSDGGSWLHAATLELEELEERFGFESTPDGRIPADVHIPDWTPISEAARQLAREPWVLVRVQWDTSGCGWRGAVAWPRSLLDRDHPRASVDAQLEKLFHGLGD